MTLKQKYTVLFFLGVLSAGLIFISISRYRFYNKFINFYYNGEDDAAETLYLEDASNSPSKTGRSSNPVIHEKIDLNSAGIQELTVIPGIGRETALKILEYRLQKGGIQKTEELIQVKGIGPKKLEMIKKYVIIK
ncbi:MAG: ComEA family DNA-binding protein [Spirochaetota bacterium]